MQKLYEQNIDFYACYIEQNRNIKRAQKSKFSLKSHWNFINETITRSFTVYDQSAHPPVSHSQLIDDRRYRAETLVTGSWLTPAGGYFYSHYKEKKGEIVKCSKVALCNVPRIALVEYANGRSSILQYSRVSLLRYAPSSPSNSQS